MTQIRCLTSLRFFPAAMIVVFHSVDAFDVWDNRQSPYLFGQGVSFFFVLSGFVLTYVYPSLRGDHRIREFYIARIARIWPAHLATFFLLLCLIPSAEWVWKDEHGWQIGAANLLLLQAWIPAASYYFSFNSVSWSTSTQLFFYLVFPLLIYQFQRSWWWKLLCTIIFVTAMLAWVDFLRLPPYDPLNFSTITSLGWVLINPLVRILEFVSGMVTASLFLRWRELKILTSLPVWLWTGFELFALAAILWTGSYGPPLFLSLFHGPTPYPIALYVNYCDSFPAFALLIGVLSFERGILARLLSLKCLILLGKISFAVYLVHQVVLRWYLLHRDMFVSVPKALLYIGYWLVVLSVSFTIWRAIEKPGQRWIRSRLSSKPDPIPATVSLPKAVDS